MGGRPLAVACAAFAGGAFIGIDRSVGGGAALAWVAAAILFIIGLVAAAVGRAPAWAAAMALGLAAGLARGAAVGPPARDAALDALPEPAREPTIVVGRVLESDRAPQGRRRVLLQIEERETFPGGPIEPSAARTLLALHASDDPALRDRPVPRPGDRVRLLARLRAPPPALNPGGRDVRRQLALRGIAYRGTATEDGLVVLSRGPGWRRALAELRDRFAARCQEVCGTPERGALVAALAVGDRSDLPREVEDELARSGLVHLLSSAGLHLAAVCLFVQWLAARLWLRTRWAHRWPAAAFGAACALPFAAAEVALLGAGWPAVRAGVGAALWLTAAIVARRSDSPTALAFSAAGCAAWDPAAAHDLALQLSFAGVAGLIFLTRPIREALPLPRPSPGAPLWRRFAEHALLAGCATAAASLCTAPIVAAAFHRVSLASVPANALALWPGLLAIPVATFAVPLDALGLALPLLWPPTSAPR